MAQDENPFKGPSSYEDGDKFYGRETELKELITLVRSEPLCLLFSRSGTGKSSLIKAGLFPELKKDGEFFPIYIHLNDCAVKETSAINLTDFVLKRCKEEINEYFGKKDCYKVSMPQNTEAGYLFEFIHNTQIIEIDSSASTEYLIKPILVFDQFEEIFTMPLDSSELQFVLKEIKCLLENEVPDYLKETMINSNDEKYTRLKNILRSKQRNFRVLFSFREEYLPQFESLRKELPSIRFTNSRYRLEPFTIETATAIITNTAPAISQPVALIVAENIAAKNEGFEEKRVDPFLLSLVCQVIYFDLLKENNILSGETKLRVNRLVENAIENYIVKVYGQIDEKTKAFIETKLITTDGKKNSINYNSVVDNVKLVSDIRKLVDNGNYRLLNIGQFLDSQHISILHDRLIPPLFVRKETRLADDISKKQKAFEASYEKRQKKLLYSLFFAISLIAVFIFLAGKLYKVNSEIVEERTKAVRAKELADSTNIKLDSTSKNLISKESILKEVNKRLQAKSDSLKKVLVDNNELVTETKIKNKILKEQNDALANTRRILKETNDSLEVSQLLLEYQLDNVNKEKENKNKLATFLNKQTNLLISSLRNSDPFIALSIARSNYNKVMEEGIDDTSIINSFQKTLLDVYNQSDFFKGEDFSFTDYQLSPKAGLIASVSKNLVNTSILIHKVSDPRSSPDSIKIDNAFLGKIYERGNIKNKASKSSYINLLKYGFTDNGEYFYANLFWEKDWILCVWKLNGSDIATEYYWSEILSGSDGYDRDNVLLKGDKLIAYSFSKKSVKFESFDFDLKKRKNKRFDLSGSDKCKDISENLQSLIIYNNKDGRKDIGTYKILNSGSRKPRSFLERDAGRQIESIFFDGNSIVSIIDKDKFYEIQFADSSGNVNDSVRFEYKVYKEGLLLNSNSLVAVERDSSQLKYRLKNIAGWNDKSIPVFTRERFLRPAYNPLAFSVDHSFLAFMYKPRSIAIYDFENLNSSDTLLLPEEIKSTPFFNSANNIAYLVGTNKIFKFYFRKPEEEVRSVAELEKILNSGIFAGAWPIPLADKEKYGIQ